jgi:hypothetical protein
MTSVFIIHGVAPSRPNMINVKAGTSYVIEGVPNGVDVRNFSGGLASTVPVNGDDSPTGDVAGLAVGDTLAIAADQRYRISGV